MDYSTQRKVYEVLDKFVNAFGKYNIKQVCLEMLGCSLYQNMTLLCLERV